MGQFAGVLAVSQGTITVLGTLVVVALILASAFFASAEIAIFSLADHRIASLVDVGTPGAETLSLLKDDPRRLLVTILVGNNIANIGMSAITTAELAGICLGGSALTVRNRLLLMTDTDGQRGDGHCGPPEVAPTYVLSR